MRHLCRHNKLQCDEEGFPVVALNTHFQISLPLTIPFLIETPETGLLVRFQEGDSF